MSEELCQLGVRNEELGVISASQLVSVTNQLLSVVARLEARIAALEEDGKVTVLHQDALKLSQLIRERAKVLTDKYQMGPAGERKLRAAIKRRCFSSTASGICMISRRGGFRRRGC